MKSIFVLIIWLYTSCTLATTEVIAFQTDRFASAAIDSTGGSVRLENVGTVDFPKNAFESATTVSIKATASAEIPQIFEIAAILFGPVTVFTNAVKIGTGLQPPNSDSIKTRIFIPEALRKEIASGARLEIFAGIEQGGANEIPFTSFDRVDSSYNEKTSELEFELFGGAFAKTELTEGEYQAILVIAAIKKN